MHDAHPCEHCGYGVPEPDDSAICPECGRAARAERIGSAWQAAPGAGRWARTSLEALRDPKTLFRAVTSAGLGNAYALLWAHVGVSAVLLSLAALGPMAVSMLSGRTPRVPGLTDWTTAAQLLALAWVVFAALLGVSVWGVRGALRLGSRWRGRRIDRDTAVVICAHAGVGLTLGAGLALLAAPLAPRVSSAVWVLSSAHWARTALLVEWLLPPCAFLAGVVLFLRLVSVGVGARRYLPPG